MAEAEPHVDEDEWTRLWEHTLHGADRRRITEAVKAGAVLEDRTEALLAAELARRMRPAFPRTTRVLIWINTAGFLVSVGLFASQWPGVAWHDFLLPLLFFLNGANAVWTVRSHGRRRQMLERAEHRNLAHVAERDRGPDSAGAGF